MSYSNHERGFALASRRSPRLSRLYVQCARRRGPGAWPDRRIWDELHARLYDRDGGELEEGPDPAEGRHPGACLRRRADAVRPAVISPAMPSHIVPPTGAKGLNLAAADVRVLSRALIEFFRTGATERLDRYSDTCLKRVWKGVRYSNYMTSLLHRFEQHRPFERRVQQAELEYVAGSLRGAHHHRRELRRPAVRGGLTPPAALRILPINLPTRARDRGACRAASGTSARRWVSCCWRLLAAGDWANRRAGARLSQPSRSGC